MTEAKRMSVSEKYGEAEWIEEFVEAHPILRHLPAHIKKSLKEVPSPDLRRLPDCNRRRRKVLEQGFVVYLYAGKKEDGPCSQGEWRRP